MVSVIVHCYNEEKFIRSFLSQIVVQDYPVDKLEVFIIDGMSDDHSRELISEYELRYPFIHLLLNERRFVPFALNMGIRKASGEVIVRMDVHSGYPADYISVLARNLYDLNADNVGGVWKTRPANGSWKANAIAASQLSAFGVGYSFYRFGGKGVMKVGTVPFGCFRKSIFDRVGLFDEELLRNQDDEFNARILENGGSVYLVPDVVIDYYARPNISSLARMFFQYAFYKPLVNKKLKRPGTVRQFIPPLFLLFLLFAWTGMFISPHLLDCYVAGTGTYLVTNLFFTLKTTLENRKIYLLFYLPWLFFLQHLSYGSGYLAGVINFRLLKNSNASLISSR